MRMVMKQQPTLLAIHLQKSRSVVGMDEPVFRVVCANPFQVSWGSDLARIAIGNLAYVQNYAEVGNFPDQRKGDFFS